ncbi:hypothetical protein CRUP_021452, partial [Coryphaenoides rupestris]
MSCMGILLLRIDWPVACMQLINALVTSPDDLDFRIHLRNEFLRSRDSQRLAPLRLRLGSAP